MSTPNPALKRYNHLIDELTANAERNFGGLGDPLFEGVRFYTCDRVGGCFNHDRLTELGAEKVNEIECMLMQTEESLLTPVLTKLKSIAPQFNKNGKFVFLASWGMGPGEIGWYIRYLNDRSMFEQYLAEAGISEAEVDFYNEAFTEELQGAGFSLAHLERAKQMPRPRTQLQENTLQQLVGTLEDLADFDAQRRYKRSVPFVHVPIELAEQWCGYVQWLDGRVKWFLDLFAPNELAAIREFDLLFQKIDMGGNFPDVEEVFKREDWLSVSAAAKILLSVLRKPG